MGSRLTNFVGILSKGLKIAPPEAPVTGYMFGKGVYFADVASKSANYCHSSKINPIGILLLAEVACGNTCDKFKFDYDAARLPSGKHSTKGVGVTSSNPVDDVILKNGCIVPCGKGRDDESLKGKTSLQYNEYIVYDLAQINLKYLVVVKFNYKYA